MSKNGRVIDDRDRQNKWVGVATMSAVLVCQYGSSAQRARGQRSKSSVRKQASSKRSSFADARQVHALHSLHQRIMGLQSPLTRAACAVGLKLTVSPSAMASSSFLLSAAESRPP